MTSTTILVQPPIARRQETITTIHGHRLADDYGWLREKTNPEVIAFLEQENAYTGAVMKPTAELQASLYAEMISHIKESDISVPFRDGDYFYYTRTEQGAQYPIYCRKHGSLDAGEEIILDMNQMAAGFLALGAFTVSDDGNLLAYSTDTTGFRQYTLHIKDLRTGEVLSDQAQRVGSVVWAADNRTLFYTVEDEATKRQFQLFRHVLGEPQAKMSWYTKKAMNASISAPDARGMTNTSFWRAPAILPAKNSFYPPMIRKDAGRSSNRGARTSSTTRTTGMGFGISV